MNIVQEPPQNKTREKERVVGLCLSSRTRPYLLGRREGSCSSSAVSACHCCWPPGPSETGRPPACRLSSARTATWSWQTPRSERRWSETVERHMRMSWNEWSEQHTAFGGHIQINYIWMAMTHVCRAQWILHTNRYMDFSTTKWLWLTQCTVNNNVNLSRLDLSSNVATRVHVL